MDFEGFFASLGFVVVAINNPFAEVLNHHLYVLLKGAST